MQKARAFFTANQNDARAFLHGWPVRVLLTGATGFVGGRILSLLLTRGFDVVPLSRRPVGRTDGLPWVIGDLVELDLDSAIRADVGAICHVAAAVSLGDGLHDLTTCLRDNVMATNRLLEFALQRRISRFVSSSSVSLYQRPVARVPVDENYPVTASSFYAASKLLNEMALGAGDVRDRITSFALRCSSIYGPGMRPSSVLPTLLDRARRGEPIRIQGSGQRSQDFVFVDDVAEAHVAALGAAAGPGLNVCNVGSGVETSLNQLAGALLDVFSSTKRSSLEHVPRHDEPEDRFFLDITRLRHNLGVTPIGLIDGLRRMAQVTGGVAK